MSTSENTLNQFECKKLAILAQIAMKEIDLTNKNNNRKQAFLNLKLLVKSRSNALSLDFDSKIVDIIRIINSAYRNQTLMSPINVKNQIMMNHRDQNLKDKVSNHLSTTSSSSKDWKCEMCLELFNNLLGLLFNIKIFL